MSSERQTIPDYTRINLDDAEDVAVRNGFGDWWWRAWLANLWMRCRQG